MVAGGGHGKRGPGIESTEALVGLDAMAWTIMTSLPKPMRLPGMVTLGNKLYLAGDIEISSHMLWKSELLQLVRMRMKGSVVIRYIPGMIRTAPGILWGDVAYLTSVLQQGLWP